MLNVAHPRLPGLSSKLKCCRSTTSRVSPIHVLPATPLATACPAGDALCSVLSVKSGLARLCTFAGSAAAKLLSAHKLSLSRVQSAAPT